MKQTKLIIFDWDGTLVDSQARIIHSYQQAALQTGLDKPQGDAIRQTIGLSLSESLTRVYKPEQITQEITQQFLAHYRVLFHHPDAQAMPLFEGVKKGLQTLKDHGYWLSVATGKARRGLDLSLQELQMDSFFMYSRCADEARSKPHPQMLFDTLDYTGLTAPDCVMIGDTSFDLEMAQGANIKSIAVTYGAHPKEQLINYKSAAMVDHFDEIVHLFCG